MCYCFRALKAHNKMEMSGDNPKRTSVENIRECLWIFLVLFVNASWIFGQLFS